MFQVRFSPLRSVGFVALLCVFFPQMMAFGQAVPFQRFDTQAAFIAANSSPNIVSYDTFPAGRFITYEQTFATE
jgi:hypothetical protein